VRSGFGRFDIRVYPTVTDERICGIILLSGDMYRKRDHPVIMGITRDYPGMPGSVRDYSGITERIRDHADIGSILICQRE
jgi:hypothetical protein